MNKIGIVTFHRASNYGAVLQAYALRRVIGGFGSHAEIVDYRGWAVERDHNPSKILSSVRSPMLPVRYLKKRAKFKVFERFRRERLPMSETVTSDDIFRLDGVYDLFIAGSDQVWSEAFSGLDPVYRLDFVEKSRRATYACSFGFTEFPEGSETSFRKSLERLETVSVREASARGLIEKELGIAARVDLDPTLLLSAGEWREMAKRPAEKDYILVYTVQPPEALLGAARRKAAETGLEVVYLNNSYKGDRDLRHVRYATPEEFLGWFDGASYVYTNSFHGTVFSIVFEKELVVECRTKKKYNNRSRALLELTGLEGREMTESCAGEGAIDWLDVRARLATAREDSLDYLRSLCSGKGASLNE